MKPKILIVDDDRDFVTVMTEIFRREGFEVLVAHEGVRAIESANKNQPDLILLDFKMPAGSGLSVIDALRARPETQKIPVVVLSGVDEPGIESTFKAKGAKAYIRKPFQKGDLLETVYELIGGLNPERP